MLWLKDAKGHSEASIDKAAAAIDRYEGYVKGADFRAFHVEKPRGFKRHLAAARNAKTGAPLGRGTVDATLRDVMAFFRWLADQPGYRSRVRHPDVTYFTPDRRGARAAHGGCWKPHPSPEQLRHVLAQMPSDTVIERRNRAAVAFLFLTGSRETAAISIRLSHIDLAARCVHFDGRTVDTKFGKSFTTTFFPVGEAAERIVAEWVAELRRDHLWGPSDPFLPRTRIAVGPDGGFQAAGLDRAPWAKAKPLAQLFKDAFAAAEALAWHHGIDGVAMAAEGPHGSHAEALQARLAASLTVDRYDRWRRWPATWPRTRSQRPGRLQRPRPSA